MRALRLSGGAALLVFALGGCGSSYPSSGPCTQDADCRLCLACGCPRAYATSDLDGADCAAVAQAATCPDGASDACGVDPRQALCVSGHCAAVER